MASQWPLCVSQLRLLITIVHLDLADLQLITWGLLLNNMHILEIESSRIWYMNICSYLPLIDELSIDIWSMFDFNQNLIICAVKAMYLFSKLIYELLLFFCNGSARFSYVILCFGIWHVADFSLGISRF